MWDLAWSYFLTHQYKNPLLENSLLYSSLLPIWANKGISAFTGYSLSTRADSIAKERERERRPMVNEGRRPRDPRDSWIRKAEGRATGLGELESLRSLNSRQRLVNTRKITYQTSKRERPGQTPLSSFLAHVKFRCQRVTQGNVQSPVAKTGPNQSSRSWCWIDSIPSTLHKTLCRFLQNSITTWLPPQFSLLMHVFCSSSCAVKREIVLKATASVFPSPLATLLLFTKASSRTQVRKGIAFKTLVNSLCWKSQN